MAEETYTPPPEPLTKGKAVEATLTDKEIKEIEKLNGIKAAYWYNVVLDPQFDWYTKVNGQKFQASPLPANFLNALHPSLAYGRYFNKSDKWNSCILSSNMSNAIFGTSNSIGKTITVYTESGKSVKYRVIGVLSKEVTDPKYMISLPFITFYGFIIPYNPTLRHKSNFATLNSPFFNNLLIIPKQGYYNSLIKGIKKILGKDYPYLVSSLSNLMKYTIGAQTRYNRIKTLLLISILTVITALFTLIEFLILEIRLRKKEIGIKRALGKTIKSIAFNKVADVFKYYIAAFVVAVIIIKISLPHLQNYTKLGYFVPGVIAPTLSQILPLRLSIPAIIIAFILLLLFIVFSIMLSVSKMLATPPALLIKDSKTTYKHNSRIALIVILALCSTTFLASLSIINIQKKEITALYDEVNPSIVRLVPATFLSYNTYRNFMNITYEDYLTLKEKLKGKALIGYRCDFPLSNGKMGDKSFVRISQATEQYPELYGFKVVEGRFINDSDFNKSVCAVGEALAEKNKLKIGRIFTGRTVVGIVQGNNFLVNHTVYIPLNKSATAAEISHTPRGRYGGQGLILLKAINGYSNSDVIKTAKKILIQYHPGKDAPCIANLKEIIDSVYQARVGMFIILSIFTLLSLLSAFLSLSALLFIEVIRRTREIGIKKAIGATSREIIKEFTMNGLITTIIALVMGIPIGIVISLIIEKTKGWNYYIPVNILILIILVSLALGFIFSFLPALFASHIKPVEAIRSE